MEGFFRSTNMFFCFWSFLLPWYRRGNTTGCLATDFIFRNPNSPTPLEITWPQYTAEREEYIALAPNFTVRSKMRPQKMELWNEFLPDQLKVESTTDIPKPASTEAEPDDDKGTYSKIQSSELAFTSILFYLGLIPLTNLTDFNRSRFGNLFLWRAKGFSHTPSSVAF